MFHPDKSYAKLELSKIKTDLFFEFQKLSEESQHSFERKLQLLEDFLPTGEIRTPKVESAGDRPLAALEGTFKNNAEPTHQEQAQTKVSMDKYIQSQVRAKLMHKPRNELVQEKNELPNILRQRYVHLSRYIPVLG